MCELLITLGETSGERGERENFHPSRHSHKAHGILVNISQENFLCWRFPQSRLFRARACSLYKEKLQVFIRPEKKTPAWNSQFCQYRLRERMENFNLWLETVFGGGGRFPPKIYLRVYYMYKYLHCEYLHFVRWKFFFWSVLKDLSWKINGR